MTDANSEREAPNSEQPENGASGKQQSKTPYPYYGLQHAIDMVQAIRKVGGKEAQSAAVMKEMEIPKTTDRLWAYGVPSAVLFGLVERIGRGDTGRLKVTDLGLRVTSPVTQEAGRVAKLAAMRTTDLYTKLLEQFAGITAPSRDGLKNLLFTDFGIVESMAMMAADAFLESLKTAELLTPAGEIAVDGVASKEKEKKANDTLAPPGMQTLHVPGDYIIYKCKIGKGRVIDIPLPPNFTTAEVSRLHAFLQTQVDDVDDVDDGGQK